MQSTIKPRATAEGTKEYRQRFSGRLPDDHFREAEGLCVSSIGIGTYLGEADEETDRLYTDSVGHAVLGGINVIDTAANYRFQRSERSIGQALHELFSDGGFSREEIVITTKGGYIPFDGNPPRTRQEMTDYLENTFIKPGFCTWDDFVQGSHCMTPGYLAHQLNQSLENLKLDGIDGYYIHNPESQFGAVSRAEFSNRLRAAFEFLETAVDSGKISFYGTATWNGYRSAPESTDYLSLEEVVRTAKEVAGENHHFKIVQLPVNLAMVEAFTTENQTLNNNKTTLLDAAADLGVTVMASASILQSRLAADLPPIVKEAFPGLRTDAQRAIQFTRSTPGLTTALIGMRNIQHVDENLEVAAIPPATKENFLKLFSK